MASCHFCADTYLDEATQAPELRELEFFQHLRRQNPGHVGYPYVVHLTDSFYIDRPHGRHLCVVTEMALCNLLSIAEQSCSEYRIPEYGAKRVIQDVLSALDYVHNDCNIIHMGGPCVLHSRILSNICVDVKSPTS